MGLWDSITNIFTGDPVKKAAGQQQQYIAGQNLHNTNLYNDARTGGLAALRSGQTGALDAVAGGVATGRNDISASVDPAIAALMGGTDQSAGVLSTGRDAALSDLSAGVDQAAGAYNPLQALGGKYGDRVDLASLMSESALGLRGAAGNDAATAAFRAGPGYGFAVDQGLESILRNANASGMVAGGNQLQESQRFGQGMADQEFQQWLKNLSGREALYAPLESDAYSRTAAGKGQAYLTGATGAANIHTGTAGRLSDLYTGAGRDAAGIYTGAGKSLADLASRGGFGAADIFGAGGRSEAELLRALATGESGAGQALVNPMLGTYSAVSNAEMGGSKNLWDLVAGGAKGLSGAGWLPTGPWQQSKTAG